MKTMMKLSLGLCAALALALSTSRVFLSNARDGADRRDQVLRAVDFLGARFRPGTPIKDIIERMHFVVEGDRDFLMAVRIEGGREGAKEGAKVIR